MKHTHENQCLLARVESALEPLVGVAVIEALLGRPIAPLQVLGTAGRQAAYEREVGRCEDCQDVHAYHVPALERLRRLAKGAS